MLMLQVYYSQYTGKLTLTTALIQQFDTLPVQCRTIEHMHEGLWFKLFFSDKMTAMRT